MRYPDNEPTSPSLPAHYHPLQPQPTPLLSFREDLWSIRARNEKGDEGWLVFAHKHEIMFLCGQEQLNLLDVLLSEASQQIEACEGTQYSLQYAQRLGALRAAAQAYEHYHAQASLKLLNQNPYRRWARLLVEAAQVCGQSRLVGSVVSFIATPDNCFAEVVYCGGKRIAERLPLGPTSIQPADCSEEEQAKALEAATLELIRRGYQDITHQESQENYLKIFRHKRQKEPIRCESFDQVARLLEEARVEDLLHNDASPSH